MDTGSTAHDAPKVTFYRPRIHRKSSACNLSKKSTGPRLPQPHAKPYLLMSVCVCGQLTEWEFLRPCQHSNSNEMFAELRHFINGQLVDRAKRSPTWNHPSLKNTNPALHVLKRFECQTAISNYTHLEVIQFLQAINTKIPITNSPLNKKMIAAFRSADPSGSPKRQIDAMPVLRKAKKTEYNDMIHFRILIAKFEIIVILVFPWSD